MLNINVRMLLKHMIVFKKCYTNNPTIFQKLEKRIILKFDIVTTFHIGYSKDQSINLRIFFFFKNK